MKKALTLSIVIPVYNEANHLKLCLETIAAQTVKPDEVIVVDNNSTDGTAALARSYDFVRLVHEKRQGVLFAARTGFDAAAGDIICRIDADTMLPAVWLAEVQNFFLAHSEVSAVTGNCYFYDFPFRRGFRIAHHGVYYGLQKLVAGTEILWGSNMAIKKSAWQKVAPSCLMRPDIHEDIDLSLHLQKQGLKIQRWPRLAAEVSLRRGDFGPASIIRYLWPWPKTYWANKRYWQAGLIGFILVAVWLFVLPASIAVQAAGGLRNFFKHLFA